jgi:hypothetical protein
MARPVLNDERLAALVPQIAELELGMDHPTRQTIAEAVGVTVKTLKTIMDGPHYQEFFGKLVRKREHVAEREAVESTYTIRKKLTIYSSEAIECVVELMRSSKDDRVKLSAACEIIDRDGRFAKVSRMMNVNQGQDGAPMLPEDISAEILDALKGVKGTVQ